MANVYKICAVASAVSSIFILTGCNDLTGQQVDQSFGLRHIHDHDDRSRNGQLNDLIHASLMLFDKSISDVKYKTPPMHVLLLADNKDLIPSAKVAKAVDKAISHLKRTNMKKAIMPPPDTTFEDKLGVPEPYVSEHKKHKLHVNLQLYKMAHLFELEKAVQGWVNLHEDNQYVILQEHSVFDVRKNVDLETWNQMLKEMNTNIHGLLSGYDLILYFEDGDVQSDEVPRRKDQLDVDRNLAIQNQHAIKNLLLSSKSPKVYYFNVSKDYWNWLEQHIQEGISQFISPDTRKEDKH